MNNNIFVPISRQWRYIIILYFLFWRIFPLAVSHLSSSGTEEYILFRLIFNIANQLLLMLPFFIYQLCGKPIGWLHPLVLPSIIFIPTSIIKSPSSILTPLLILSQPANISVEHILLSGWSNSELSMVGLKSVFLDFLSIIFTYLGFFSLNIKSPNIKFYNPRNLRAKIIILFTLVLVLAIYIIQSSGGVLAHISQLSAGRFHLRNDGGGQTLVIINFAPYILTTWYVYRPKVLNRLDFWILFLLGCGLQFVVTGSRASVFYPLIVLFIAWIFLNRKISLTRTLSIGLVIFLLLGILGDIRQSSQGGRQEADLSPLTNFNISDAIESTTEEPSNRKNSTIPVIAMVPEQIDHLWGASYLGALTFYVPRGIWPGKPRGAGAYAGAVIWSGRDTVSGYNGASIPLSATAEAYWNFNIPGVLLIFFLHGAYRRWLSSLLWKYPGQPMIIIFYVISVSSFSSPGTDKLVPYLQQLVMLVASSIFLGALRPFSTTRKTALISGSQVNK